jgi:hypothetical protein
VLERAAEAGQWGEVKRIAAALDRLQAAFRPQGSVVSLSSFHAKRGGL